MEAVGAVLFLVVLIALIFIKVPIGFAIGLVSLAGFIIYQLPLEILAQRLYTGMASPTWLAIPLFILAGTLMGRGGLSRRLVNFSESILGQIKGGLGVTTIFSAAFFSSISGASPATAAAIGSVMIPEMKEKGYPEKLAAGITAAGGVLGVLIPPSIILIAYGVLAQVSIVELFMAALIPGFLTALSLMIVTYFMARSLGANSTSQFSFRKVWDSLREGILSLLAPVLILGGIYLGIFTPTESAVVAVAYGIIVGAIYRELTVSAVIECVKVTVITTGALAIIWAAASSYAYVLTLSGITQQLAALMLNVSENPIIILLLISLLVVVLGAYINAMGMVILLTPIFVPILVAIDFNLIAFGVIFVVLCEIGYITPPVGTNLFVVKSFCKNAGLLEISAVVIPFIVMLLAISVFLILFPGVITFLPELLS